MVRLRMWRPAALGALGLCLASVVAGCGKPYEIGEVEGVITIDGKPLPQARVEFHPDAENGTKGPSSGAETDEQGRFKLTYYLPNASAPLDGAVVGKHKVLVFDLKVAADSTGATRLRFAPSYTQIGTTPLTKEVKPGKQTIEIELNAR
ncbi:MAG TPA: hypothetical protein VKE74_31480 [Gemmataceae bacterium]|nr:hypothetical protein [Gemmataceae bacterium]